MNATMDVQSHRARRVKNEQTRDNENGGNLKESPRKEVEVVHGYVTRG